MSDGTKHVEGHGWKYIDTDGLYSDAVKAMLWYEATGMRVAKNPAMPEIVARWILRNVVPKAVV